MSEIAKKVKLLETIDAEKIIIKKDRYFSKAYFIDLPLDSTPNHVWQDIFEREWKSSRYLWDRKLFVMGDKLRLVTTPYDIEDKLDWIKQVINQTNKAIEEYSQKPEVLVVQAEERLEKQKIEEEKANVEMIRDLIRKTFGSW